MARSFNANNRIAMAQEQQQQEPPLKRLKQSEEEEEDESLLQIMLEESTTRNKQQEEADAVERRLERRKRWKQQTKTTTATTTTSTDTADNPTEDTTVPSPPPQQEQQKQQDDDDDDFDMFSSSVSPVVSTTTTTTTTTTTKKDDFDDAEGYYKPVIGETIDCASQQHYKVLGIVGKGVFSTVLKGKSTHTSNNNTNNEHVVALKLIRNNDTMRKASMTEIKVLLHLSSHPHVVPLLHPTSCTHESDDALTLFHGHVVMVFPFMQYNLRDVLQKFGRSVGISIASIQRYFLQLLSALRHLQKHAVLHSDIKPDNILVSGDYSTLQLCDFGSATLLMGETTSMMVATPYLVSRFYRAPEIILGAIPSYPIDLWSAAVSMAEVFLGKVLFTGTNNNELLYNIYSILGPPSPKLVKQHSLNVETHPGLPKHVQGNYFLQQDVDKATGILVKKQVPLHSFSSKSLSLQSLVLQAKSKSDSRVLVMQFCFLLKSCLAYDPTRRIDLKTAMQHEFFVQSSSTNKSGTGS